MEVSRLKGRHIVDAYEDGWGVDCLVLDDGTVIEEFYITKLSPEDEKIAEAERAQYEADREERLARQRELAIEDTPRLAALRAQIDSET